MSKQRARSTAVQRAAALAQSRVLTDSELLALYMRLTTQEREEQFADTTRVAVIAGMSRRTVQLWIEIGLLQAIRVGRKQYKISLESLRESLQKQIDD